MKTGLFSAVFLMLGAAAVQAQVDVECVKQAEENSIIVDCSDLAGDETAKPEERAIAEALLGDAVARTRDWSSALGHYRKSLEFEPNNPEVLISQGIILGITQDFIASIASFDAALELEPDSTRALYSRGNVYRRSGRPALAVRDYTRALELDPKYTSALNNRGFAYLDMGELEKAAQEWNEMLRRADRGTVRKWQAMLKEQGFYRGGIDGSYGPGSRRALFECVKQKVCFQN